MGHSLAEDWRTGRFGMMRSASRNHYPGATVALDFTRNRYRVGAGTGYTSLFSAMPNLTVTRASVGYAERNDGTLVLFGTNTARITDKGLLVEEARTNLLLQSQTFDNASWTKTNSAAVTPNAVTAPDGTLTADKLQRAAAATTFRAQQAATILNATAYTYTVYAKAGEITWLAVFDAGTANVGAYFNLTAGTVGTTESATTASITPLANGWYRCRITYTSGATTATIYNNLAEGDGDATFPAGNTTDGLYLWGAQLEAGAFPTSYIPTTTASATRAADVVSIGSVNNPAAFSVVAQFIASAAAASTSYVPWDWNDGTTQEQADVYQSTGGVFKQFARDGNVTQADLGTRTYTTQARAKLAARFETNNFGLSVNGQATETDTSGTIPTLTTLRVGSSAGGVYQNNYVERLVIYPRAFTDAELQAATT